MVRREMRTSDLASLAGWVREEALAAAGPERREQMARAERSREVMAAWNRVCGGTREGRHVTGLRYLPESNELLVYLDDPGWTQEMTMLREIIRARMARLGVDVDGFVFRTSRAGYRSAAQAASDQRGPSGLGGEGDPAGPWSRDRVIGRGPDGRAIIEGPMGRAVVAPVRAGDADRAPAAPRRPLSPEEESTIERAVSQISDTNLAEALKRAMEASLSWKTSDDCPDGV